MTLENEFKILLLPAKHSVKVQSLVSTHCHDLTHSEKIIIDQEVKKSLDKTVIYECDRVEGDFISPVFTGPKKDGTLRMIPNLKQFNSFVTYKHFKMESLNDVLSIVKSNVLMASVDLKDAFYTIAVHIEYQKYFKFRWVEKFFQFCGIPNGLGPAMKIFTKTLKPPFSILRQKGPCFSRLC